jgi:hypothetical protein
VAPLYDPSSPVPSQLAAILLGGPRMIAAGWDNRVDAAPDQAGAQRVAIIAAIGNQALGPYAGASRHPRAADRDHVEGPLEARDLRRGCRLQVCSQRSFCWSWSWARKARHSLSSTPVSSHCLRRRQQVLGLPYRRGSSLHWAPVQRIQRMPSKQRRSATRGRPPRGDTFGWGRWMRMASHCCVVRLLQAMMTVEGATDADVFRT